jgi:hypothetical protein
VPVFLNVKKAQESIPRSRLCLTGNRFLGYLKGLQIRALELTLFRTLTLYSTYCRAEARVHGMGSSWRTGTLQTINLPYSVHIAELRLECGAGVLAVELALFRPPHFTIYSLYCILHIAQLRLEYGASGIALALFRLSIKLFLHIAELRLECGAGVLAVELALFRPSLNQQRLNCSEIGRWRWAILFSL